MLVLALESVCVGIAADKVFLMDHPKWPNWMGIAADEELLRDYLKWQNWALLCGSFLPGLWLLFSFVYARGNALEFISRWKWGMAAVFFLPIALALVLKGRLVFLSGDDIIRWKPAALALQIVFLLSSVLVLMNLERTFRSAVGTMRWRIKFMVLGLGVLFSVRAYTASQFLVLRAVDPGIQALNSSVLLLGGLDRGIERRVVAA
jgi:hypothetical protein